MALNLVFSRKPRPIKYGGSPCCSDALMYISIFVNLSLHSFMSLVHSKITVPIPNVGAASVSEFVGDDTVVEGGVASSEDSSTPTSVGSSGEFVATRQLANVATCGSTALQTLATKSGFNVFVFVPSVKMMPPVCVALPRYLPSMERP